MSAEDHFCRVCGYELTWVQKFEDAGLPCNHYCCSSCCPNRNETPCPKEKLFPNF